MDGGVRVHAMKIFWMAAVLALTAEGGWAEEKKPVDEKKEEVAGWSQEENIKVGRGRAFQAFAEG